MRYIGSSSRRRDVVGDEAELMKSLHSKFVSRSAYSEKGKRTS